MRKKEMDKIGMEFAKAMGHASVKATKMEMTNGITLIDETAEPFIKAAGKSPDLLLELTRRIAENKLLLSYEKRRPLEEVESYYEALRKLGFTDFAQKVAYTIVLARHCMRCKNIEKATRLLKKLQREANNHVRFYQALKYDVDEMIKKVQEKV